MLKQLAGTLLNELQAVLPTSTKDLPEKELRAVLGRALNAMELVSRDEFDAQQAVLLRTREKLEGLEAQIKALEETLK